MGAMMIEAVANRLLTWPNIQVQEICVLLDLSGDKSTK